jgi:hypothetical protein
VKWRIGIKEKLSSAQGGPLHLDLALHVVDFCGSGLPADETRRVTPGKVEILRVVKRGTKEQHGDNQQDSHRECDLNLATGTGLFCEHILEVV